MSPPDQAFPPPPALAATANVGADADAEAAADPGAFWARQARRLEWDREPQQAYDGSAFPTVTWFADGTLNVARNCVDRHVETGLGERRRCCGRASRPTSGA